MRRSTTRRGASPAASVPDGACLGRCSPTCSTRSTLDVKGPEFRVGVIRGTTLGGEWGVSLIHKRLSKESTIEIEGSNDLLTVIADDAELIGVEVHRFFPFARAGRVQIGVNLGGGIAQLRGFVTGVQLGSDVHQLLAAVSRGVRRRRPRDRLAARSDAPNWVPRP